MSRPSGMIDPLLDKIDLGDLAHFMFSRHRGRAKRVKTRDVAAAVLGVVARHGSAEDVSIREAIGQLVAAGCPIAGESGPDGGFFWLDSEAERQAALIPLRASLRTLQRRIDALQSASLHCIPDLIPGQQRLFEPSSASTDVNRARGGARR